MGTWKNFDEIEESLILDELLLLIEALSKKSKNNFRMLAAANGYEIPDDDEQDYDMDDDDLPEELLEAERVLKKRKQEELGPEGSGATNTSFGTGLGYEVTPKIIQNLDQTVI